MSEYIIHSIDISLNQQIDFYHFAEEGKSVLEFPNFYLGKIMGRTGNLLNLKRKRRTGSIEDVPNCVLRNEDGIALIRIHNKENYTIYELPENKENEIEDCVGVPQSSYPFAYVVVDYRDDKCQIAIEKTSSWDNKTVTIKNIIDDFFNTNLNNELGIYTSIKEKTQSILFEEFIDQRTKNHGDIIESFTFEYVNLKAKPTTRIPKELTEQMNMYSKTLEYYNAISAVTTMNMGTNLDTEKLKQLSRVVAYSSDNAFKLIVKFKDYGEYKCNENIVAKYPMNDVVISNFKNGIKPEIIDSNWDLKSWLDNVSTKITEGLNGKSIPTKPV